MAIFVTLEIGEVGFYHSRRSSHLEASGLPDGTMEAESIGLSPTISVPSARTPITKRPAFSTPLMARASDSIVKGRALDISV